jgi:hypothetical protein
LTRVHPIVHYQSPYQAAVARDGACDARAWCTTQLLYALKEALKVNGRDPLTDLMGVQLTTTLKCVESDESFEEKQVSPPPRPQPRALAAI